MKSVIFIPTLTAGGAERVASILANNWVDSSEIYILTYFDEINFYNVNSEVKIISLKMKVGQNFLLRTLDILFALVKFRRLVKNINPNFVLSFMNKYNVFCLAALFRTCIPVIVSERDSPTESLPIIRVILRDFFYKFSAGMICQTKASEIYFLKKLANLSIAVIPNPITKIINHEVRVPEKFILSVGRLTQKKAQDQLILAYSKMTVKGWTLVICGDGELRQSLKLQVTKLGLDGRVLFAGLISDLTPYFSKAGIFAFSSLYEGYPNALAEALISGVPCVSYDCPTGPSELIENGVNGLLVPVGDISALSGALDILAGDSVLAKRLGERGAQSSVELAPAMISCRYFNYCLEVSKNA